MKRVSLLSAVLMLFVVSLVVGCATSGPKQTETVPTPDIVRTFPNGMRFVLEGAAAPIMLDVEKAHLKIWGPKIKGWSKDDIQNKVLCPLYKDADLLHDFHLSQAEAEVYRDITYPKKFSTSAVSPVAFPSTQ